LKEKKEVKRNNMKQVKKAAVKAIVKKAVSKTAKKKAFRDMSGDGKVTKMDILIANSYGKGQRFI